MDYRLIAIGLTFFVLSIPLCMWENSPEQRAKRERRERIEQEREDEYYRRLEQETRTKEVYRQFRDQQRSLGR